MFMKPPTPHSWPWLGYTVKRSCSETGRRSAQDRCKALHFVNSFYSCSGSPTVENQYSITISTIRFNCSALTGLVMNELACA